MKSRILVLSPLPAAVVEALYSAVAGPDAASLIEAESFTGSSREELLESVSEADVILGDYTNSIAMDAGIIAAAERCLLIQQPSTGYQHIDVDEAARREIPVANAGGVNSVAVAEHTIMAVLGCLKKLVLSHEKTGRAEWAQDEMAGLGVFELQGRTLGIVGMGRTGTEVALRARAFGPVMVYYDPNRLPAERERELGLGYKSLDELVAVSDVITIHVPSTPETRGMFDSARISRMKKGAVLVNVSRGDLVDEAALASSLAEGHLQGAALDVFSEEPVSPDNPVLRAPNTILTPHTAGATNEARMRIISVAMENVAKVLGGGEAANVVNGVRGARRPG